MINFKRALLALILSLFFYNAHAQFRWGSVTGIQTSTIYSDRTHRSANWKTSLVVPGLFFEYQFNERMILSSEFQFANRGFNTTTTQTINNQTEKIKNSFRFPTFSQYTLFHYMPLRTVYVFAGPEVGIRFAATKLSNGERPVEDTRFSTGFEFGLAGGIALELFPGHRIMFRYTRSLIDITQSQYDSFGAINYTTAEYVNRAFQVSLNSVFEIPKTGNNSIVSFSLRQGITSFTLHKADIDGNPIYVLNQKKRIGYEAGVDMRFSIKKHFFVSTGVSFMQQGGSLNGDAPVKLGYLGIPIAIGYYPVKTDLFSLAVEGGISLNREVNKENPYENQPYKVNHELYPNPASYFYGLEVSTDVIRKMTLFLSYRRGFENTFLGKDDADGNNYTEYYTKGHSLSLGIRSRNRRNDHAERAETIYNDYFANTSSMGFKGGINLSKISYQNEPFVSEGLPGTGFGSHIGIYFRIKLARVAAFTPEFQYMKLNSRIKMLESPMLVSYSLSKRVDIETGPQWGTILDFKEKKIGSYKESSNALLTLGWNAGARFNITQNFSVGARYYHGFTNMVAWYDSMGKRSTTEGYNRNVQLSSYLRLFKFSKNT